MQDLITLTANHSFKETVEKVIELIKEKQFTIFAHIDHSKAAESIGLQLLPVQLIIFGNPEIGTLLMQDQQTCGIDLPVKILIWENASGKVSLSYNALSNLKAKHKLNEESFKVVQKIETVVSGICHSAAK